eukprot:4903543-Prymnesium_polylepis.1
MIFGSSLAGRKVEPGPTCNHTVWQWARSVPRQPYGTVGVAAVTCTTYNYVVKSKSRGRPKFGCSPYATMPGSTDETDARETEGQSQTLAWAARHTTQPCVTTTRTETVRCDHHSDDDPADDNF